MDAEAVYRQMFDNAERIASLVLAVSDEQACWRPEPDSWSILEVVCHLLDEEREDFGARLTVVLDSPEEDFAPIDPPGWVTERAYSTRELRESLEGFLAERADSLSALRGRTAPRWDAAKGESPQVMRAGDLLAAWAAHDLLHMRQLVALHRSWLLRCAEPYKTGYAGEW